MKPLEIGQYRITSVLGEGGMGVVYGAEHNLLGRPAAIKVLLPELSGNQEVVTRFFNEARAATAIQHPGIVQIYDFGWTPEGAAYIVMERLQGETLRSRRSRAPMAWTTSLALTRQIAGALGAAHSKGIVHRDLKPDNVFLVHDPEVPGGERIKLLDFGIAKLAGASASRHKTRTGAVMGTPTYMAPEQCRGVAVDSRADLYALGCILFELCAGRPPFVGEGEGDILAAHIHVPPPTIGSLTPGVPQEIEALVRRLLAKTPTERIQTAEEIIRIVDVSTTAVGAITPASSVSGSIAAGVIGSTTPATAHHVATTLTSAISAHALPPAKRSPRQLRMLSGVSVAVAVAALIVVAAVAQEDDEVPMQASAGAVLPPPDAAVGAVTEVPVLADAVMPVIVDAAMPVIVDAAGQVTTDAAMPVIVAKPSAPAEAPRRRPAAPPSLPPAPPPAAQVRAPAPLPPLPQTIAIEITTTPAGADVIVDGATLGKTPFRGKLPYADRRVAITLRRLNYLDQVISVRATSAIVESATLVPAPASPVPKPPRPHDRSVNPF